MTETEKRIYSDMRSIDRITLWLDKYRELIEFSKVMTAEDLSGIQKVCEYMESGAK